MTATSTFTPAPTQPAKPQSGTTRRPWKTGTVLAVVLSRRATRPQRTFVVTTVVLTALSIIPDVLADASTSTRFTLALSHVVAAAIVIPALASRLSD